MTEIFDGMPDDHITPAIQARFDWEDAQLDGWKRHPQVVPHILESAFGEAVDLSPPETVISIRQFEEIIEANVSLIGLALVCQSRNPARPNTYMRDLTSGKLADGLRDRFAGRLAHLRYMRLPVDGDMLRLRLQKPEEVDPENAARFGLSIDMKSGGRPARVNTLDVLAYVREPAAQPDQRMLITSAPRVKQGRSVAEALRREAAATSLRLTDIGVRLPRRPSEEE